METLFIGRQRFEEPELLSTNTFAQELLVRNQVIEGAVVVTQRQKAGRGQRGNSWESEHGKNLTMSIILMPVFLPLNDQFELSVVSSLALAGMVSYFLSNKEEKVWIKWPNDIYVGNRKIAGILIENVLRDNKMISAVIGLGLNVNQEYFKYAPCATSLKLECGRELNLRECEEKLCEYMEVRYLQLKAGKRELLKNDYLSHLYWLNEEHSFSSKEGAFRGTIRGVANSGKLQLQSTERGMQEFDVKEVEFVK
jgi:BirA family biotin operon repressor/biotin-[acetyl-CoA-carboxylase] ligase